MLHYFLNAYRTPYPSMRPLLLAVLLFCMSYGTSFAQKEGTWIGELYSFALSSFDAAGNAISIDKSATLQRNPTDSYFRADGFVAISDKHTGALRFMSNGLKVWDADGNFVENGELYPFTAAQRNKSMNTSIVPLEEYNQNRYIIVSYIQRGIFGSDNLWDYELTYSILDATANGGNGKILAKNIPLAVGVEQVKTEPLNAGGLIKHSDGISSWLMLKFYKDEVFRVYKINACGVVLAHEIPFKDLIPNYDAIIFKFGAIECEMYDSGLFRTYFHENPFSLVNYYFQLNRTTGFISYCKKIKGAISFTNKTTYIYNSYITTTGKIYSTRFRPFVLFAKDTLFFQTDFNSIPDNSTWDPGYGYEIDITNTPVGSYVEPFLPYPYYTNFQLFPYIDGRIFVNQQTSFYQAYVEILQPDSMCPTCDLGHWTRYKFREPTTGVETRPYPYWYQYYYQNMTYFGKGWQAPEMGTPIFTASRACPQMPVSISLQDTIRGDSIVFTTDENKTFTWGADSLRFIYGQFPIFFMNEGLHHVQAVRHINCVSDTFQLPPIEVLALAKQPVYSLSDTLYGCGKGAVKLTINTQPQELYTVNGAAFHSGTYIEGEGSFTIASATSCSTESTAITINYPAFLFPNLITPNGDGKNDVLEIAPIALEQGRLSIYNSWGQLVFEQEHYTHNWNAANVSDGVYYYHYQSANDCDTKGWLQIIR
jgi:gliding motility-associated-like protein